jgi:high-affinity Fe2+/Pb2+ permease
VGSFGLMRGALFAVGAVLVVAGVASLGLGAVFAFNSLWLIAVGGGLMIVAVLERRRYRSEAAERSNDAIGPGGGETEALEARFRPTDEVFVDPTTQRTMRVLIDPRTGERRYVAEA